MNMIIANENTGRISKIDLLKIKKVVVTSNHNTPKKDREIAMSSIASIFGVEVDGHVSHDVRKVTHSDASMDKLLAKLPDNSGEDVLMIIAAKGCKAKSAAKIYGAVVDRYPITAITADVISIKSK